MPSGALIYVLHIVVVSSCFEMLGIKSRNECNLYPLLLTIRSGTHSHSKESKETVGDKPEEGRDER